MPTIVKKSSETRMCVPFHDLDPMQVVWHGNYFKYFDRARFTLFKDSGIDLYRYSNKGPYVFPITRTKTKYILPLTFGKVFICRASIVEVHYKIVIDFEIRLAEDGRLCTLGQSQQVAVKMPEMEMLFQIPEEIRKAFYA